MAQLTSRPTILPLAPMTASSILIVLAAHCKVLCTCVCFGYYYQGINQMQSAVEDIWLYTAEDCLDAYFSCFYLNDCASENADDSYGKAACHYWTTKTVYSLL